MTDNVDVRLEYDYVRGVGVPSQLGVANVHAFSIGLGF
jgi:opacity protein-like surface antigen